MKNYVSLISGVLLDGERGVPSAAHVRDRFERETDAEGAPRQDGVIMEPSGNEEHPQATILGIRLQEIDRGSADPFATPPLSRADIESALDRAKVALASFGVTREPMLFLKTGVY